MQWTLIHTLMTLILMGQCSLFTCQLYQYHFIKENKTWDEAQKFCRKNYTDLATVSNMADMERLCNSAENQDEAWIGLHSYPGADNNTWHWSLPGLEFNGSQTRWGPDKQPNQNGGFVENCIRMDNQQWFSWRCNHTFTFICYNAETKQSNNTFYFINTTMSWPQAQSYCRQHYTDLVSGLDQLDDPTVMNISYVWIGLFRDTWKWSDGSNFTFRNWEYDEDLVDGQSNKTCATVLNRTGKWSSDYCDQQKPFYCFGDKLILIQENKTWVEALDYCRHKYRDLVSITNPDEQRWIQERVKNATTGFVWLGMRYTCTLGFWFWVSDERVSYQNWASNVASDDCDMSAVMETGGQNQWFKKPDNETFNFICA